MEKANSKEGLIRIKGKMWDVGCGMWDVGCEMLDAKSTIIYNLIIRSILRLKQVKTARNKKQSPVINKVNGAF
jgi:hypothetical protein